MRVKLYREHKYVSFALSELERLIAKTDFSDDAAIAHVQSDWQSVKEMLEGHAYHEENNFHALLEKKGSTIHHDAHHDHEHQEETLKNLQHLLEATKTSSDSIEAGYKFYLAYRKFVGDNLLHLHEEETKLLPELQRLCTDEELRAIEHPTYELMTSEEMTEMVKILFPHMNFSDKCAFLRDIKLAQPKKFQQLWDRANSFLSADEIDRIKRLDLMKNETEETNNKPLPYRLEHYDTIPKEYEEVLYQGISDRSFQAKGLSPIRSFSIFIKDQKENIVGGTSGTLFYGSLYVDSLWVDLSLRHQGWRTKLMHEAENIGRKHRAAFVTLNTMDWEALPFYQKLGYSIEFTRDGYEKDSKMYMLRKNL